MKHLPILIAALLFINTHAALAQTTNEQAITHYREAETAYQNKNYSNTLTSLEEAVKLLNQTNARIEALRIKTYTDMGNISDARKSLNTFSGFSADYSLYQELNPYIARIEQAELKELEAEQQAMQKEAETQEKQQRMHSLLTQVVAKIEQDGLDEATSLLAQAKQLNTGSAEDRHQFTNIESHLAEINEEKSLYQGAVAGRVTSMDAYLQKFADHPNAPKVTQMRREKETATYNAAVSSDRSADYERFLSDFVGSDHAGEVRQRLAVAQDREAYQFFLANRTTANAYDYLQKFPGGTHKPQVMTAYEELLYADGLEYEHLNNFSKAKETFSSYQYIFPNGKNIAQVNSKLRTIDKKIERQSTLNKIDARTYGVVSYATNGTYGIELGRLPGGRGIGGYIAGQLNGAGLQISKTTGTITQEDVDASDGYKVGVLAGSIGINYCVSYPIWLYGGAGVSYQPYYNKDMDQSFTLDGRKNLVFFPEVGVKTRLGGAILKAGIQLIQGGSAFQIGIGF